MGPHTSKDLAQLDDDAPGLGIGAPMLGRHAGGSARGPHFTVLVAPTQRPLSCASSAFMDTGAYQERSLPLYHCCQTAVYDFQVMVDTSGWAFTYPLLRLSGVRVACYTHYPTISTDMLRRVQTRQAAFNNSSSITGSTLKSAAKLLYYYIFAAMYGAVGGCANVSILLPA